MNKNILIVVSFIIVIGILISFPKMTSLYSGKKVAFETTTPFTPSETFSGIINTKTVTFEHSNYTHYRLTVNGQISEGDLNTERGFGTDEDATVFVLDFKKPESEQAYYVVTTKDPTHLQLLDAKRNMIPNTFLLKN